LPSQFLSKDNKITTNSSPRHLKSAPVILNQPTSSLQSSPIKDRTLSPPQIHLSCSLTTNF
jgi:hypothetical protein